MDKDIQAIQSIESVPHIMTMLADATGLRFICIARVTDNHWKSCSVLDKIEFNMKPGDELDIKTTLCDTVRATRAPVIIENARSRLLPGYLVAAGYQISVRISGS